jgi:hypothetical protein
VTAFACYFVELGLVELDVGLLGGLELTGLTGLTGLLCRELHHGSLMDF